MWGIRGCRVHCAGGTCWKHCRSTWCYQAVEPLLESLILHDWLLRGRAISNWAGFPKCQVLPMRFPSGTSMGTMGTRPQTRTYQRARRGTASTAPGLFKWRVFWSLLRLSRWLFLPAKSNWTEGLTFVGKRWCQAVVEHKVALLCRGELYIITCIQNFSGWWNFRSIRGWSRTVNVMHAKYTYLSYMYMYLSVLIIHVLISAVNIMRNKRSGPFLYLCTYHCKHRHWTCVTQQNFSRWCASTKIFPLKCNAKHSFLYLQRLDSVQNSLQTLIYGFWPCWAVKMGILTQALLGKSTYDCWHKGVG